MTYVPPLIRLGLKPKPKYDLHYYVGAEHKATIMYNVDYALAKHEIARLKQTTHTLGRFKIVPN